MTGFSTIYTHYVDRFIKNGSFKNRLWIIFSRSIFSGNFKEKITKSSVEKKSAFFMIFSAFFGRFLLDVNINILYNRNDIF